MAIIKYEKFLDKKESIESCENIKALSFYELKNVNEIKFFIDNCQKIIKDNYSPDKIKNIISNNKYFSYIYYYLDEPVVFSIAHIEKHRENKILKIDDLGFFDVEMGNQLKENVFREIINKAESLNLNKISLKLDKDKLNLKNILKSFDFKNKKIK